MKRIVRNAFFIEKKITSDPHSCWCTQMSTAVNPPSPRWNLSQRSPRVVTAEKRDLFCYSPSVGSSFPMKSFSLSTSPRQQTPELKESPKRFLKSEVFIAHTVSETSTPRKDFIGRNRAKSGLAKVTVVEKEKLVERHSSSSAGQNKLVQPKQLLHTTQHTNSSCDSIDRIEVSCDKDHSPSQRVLRSGWRKVVPSLQVQN